MNVFLEVHCGNGQEGPGDDASTRKALALLPGLPARPRILDVGCGPGRQTRVLAKVTGADVVAVDLYRQFLEQVRASRAAAAPVRASMTALPFRDRSFDLVWCEGAVYLMGFETGLRAWRRLVPPGGAVAVTEVTWLEADPPAEAVEFWRAEYPAMQDVAANLGACQRAGYDVVGHFALPPEAWTDYYEPLKKRVQQLRPRYASDPEARAALDQEDAEYDLWRRHGTSYGYVFYVLRNP